MIIHGDCLKEMPNIEDGSIDMILCDLPYGITACKWDSVIPFEPLWEQYKRIIKDNGAIVLFGSQPFTSALVMSNPEMFKYEWIWEKSKAGNFLQGNKRTLKRHENVLVFYNKPALYNPQKKENPNGERKLNHNPSRQPEHGKTVGVNMNYTKAGENYEKGKLLPISIIRFPNSPNPLHPTQKPVALFEYLIKTYTNPGELVLDNCAGSGTTGVACRNLDRNFILIEKEEKYIDIINKRLSGKL